MYLGDMEEASERERRSLEICCRLGYGRLMVDVLSTLSVIYRALGHTDLARAYAAEAQRRQSLAEEKERENTAEPPRPKGGFGDTIAEESEGAT